MASKPFTNRHAPPYRPAGAVLLAIVAVFAVLFVKQFHGDFAPRAELTVVSARSGLVVDPGSKVTLNGVEVGRVQGIHTADVDGAEQAVITLEVDPRYLPSIPANVVVEIRASTVFGNKYVAFSAPEDRVGQSLSTGDVIRSESVTTEYNSLFETVTSLTEKIDPIKLNQTLTATAQALSGAGSTFGRSLEDANVILDDLNPRLSRLREDVARVADLADLYADAAPDLMDGLESSSTTAHTLNDQRGDVDAALMAAIGFATTATDPVERAAPVLRAFRCRSAADDKAARRLPRHDLLHPPQLSRRRAPNPAVLRRRQRILAGGLRCTHGRRQSLRLPRQPAAHQRSRRPGGQAGLLAEGHPRAVAAPVSGH